MKLALKSLFIGLVFLGSFSSFAGAQAIVDVVDQFKQATDLQRNQIANDFFGKPFSAEAIIANVEEYNLFSEKKDTVYKYYLVTTNEQKTLKGTPYQVVFLSKDFGSVKDLKKGQSINKNGKIIRILDERLQISLWLYDGDLSPEEKELFTQEP
ncbi:MAG: hypothetical protein M0R48_05360 [Candidatus Omnitrophica bacterium]|jgi:hypothetical protein|nr:hypothetical protein [Candidatus Omnitrophota bacterium]